MQSKFSKEEEVEKIFEQTVSTAPVFSHAAKQQMAKMIEATLRSRAHIQCRLDTSQLPSQKGGFIAEEFHAESFNLDAILKDKDFQAITDQYKPEWNQLNRTGNDGVADIIITKGNKSVHVAQSKYGANAETTAGRGETGFPR